MVAGGGAVSECWHRASPRRPHLVEAQQLQLAPQVDAQRVDAEDALAPQPALGVERAHGHGSWQGGGHHHCHQVQSPDHDLVHGHLAGGTVNAKGQAEWARGSSWQPPGLTRFRWRMKML